jgi:hypothetical protein
MGDKGGKKNRDKNQKQLATKHQQEAQRMQDRQRKSSLEKKTA